MRTLTHYLALFTLIITVSALNTQTPTPEKEKVVLVTGGAGYIGSHASYFLHKAGYKVVILDSFIHQQPWPHTWATVIRKDIADTQALKSIFTTYDVQAVMHFAALIEVGTSVKKPLEYWENNVAKTLVLLKEMTKYKVRNFILSSTCAIYGNPPHGMTNESQSINPISPYARTKAAIEYALEDYANAQKINYVSLRYFNVAGACPKHGLTKDITHVIDIILDSITRGKTFHIFGNDYDTPDGTGVRDYVHVRDIADAHILAMKYLQAKHEKSPQEPHGYAFNLGTGTGFSVQELVNAATALTEKKLPIIVSPRRQGDAAYIVADPSKAQQELGWQPTRSTLKKIIKSTMRTQELSQ